MNTKHTDTKFEKWGIIRYDYEYEYERCLDDPLYREPDVLISDIPDLIFNSKEDADAAVDRMSKNFNPKLVEFESYQIMDK